MNKVAILIEGTSSSGKSFAAKVLNAVPFYKVKDPNQWAVIDSDHFQGFDNDAEERRLKLDHPKIRDWARGNDCGIVSGLYRKDMKGVPQNPYEKEYVDTTDPRNWYMAQEYKTGSLKKVIFDDIGNGILQYVPNVKHNVLIHAPINILMKNIAKRNRSEDSIQHRDPADVLKQYLGKYKATTLMPNKDVGDPRMLPTRMELKSLLMSYTDKNRFTKYTEQFINEFIDKLGVKCDGNYWVKVKDGYLNKNTQLINVDDEQESYLNELKNLT